MILGLAPYFGVDIKKRYGRTARISKDIENNICYIYFDDIPASNKFKTFLSNYDIKYTTKITELSLRCFVISIDDIEKIRTLFRLGVM